MTVIRPNSISGVTSITAQGGNINVFRADGTAGDLTINNIVGAAATFTGVLTYEDVTNIDSVGIVTARAGIKIGPTAGVAGTFFADGSYVTAGVVTATTFYGSGASLTGINADLVNDTSPQLGGNLDTNSKNIVFGDSSGSTVNRLNFGAGTDLSIRHDGTDTIFSNSTGDLYINNAGTNSDDIILSAKDDVQIKVQDGEFAINCFGDGGVELFHNNVKRFETDTDGVRVVAPEGAQAMLRLIGDEGDDNNDYFRLNAGGGTLKIQDASNGSSWEDNIVINAAGSVELYHDNSKRFETSADGILLYPDASGVLISSGGDTNWTTGAMNVVRMGSNQADIRLGSNYGVKIGVSGNNDANEFQFQQDNSNNGFIRNEASNKIEFQTGGSTARFRIDNNGNCTVNDGNLVIATNGHGIDFSATGGPAEGSGSSELFDDYEEGSFTPVWRFDPTNATSVTYNIQVGKYVKIGGVVFIRIELQVSNKGSLSSGAGWAQIDGLPYACSEYSAVSIGIYQHFNNVQPGIAHVGTSEQVYIAYDPSLSSNTSSYDLQHTHFTNNSRINISGCYYAV